MLILNIIINIILRDYYGTGQVNEQLENTHKQREKQKKQEKMKNSAKEKKNK